MILPETDFGPEEKIKNGMSMQRKRLRGGDAPEPFFGGKAAGRVASGVKKARFRGKAGAAPDGGGGGDARQKVETFLWNSDALRGMMRRGDCSGRHVC